jgi:cardiolipin synthase
VFHAGRGYYTQLLQAGVKIYERRGAILHSKTALVDGVWATVGSTNLDWRSFLHNHELNGKGAEFGAQLRHVDGIWRLRRYRARSVAPAHFDFG